MNRLSTGSPVSVLESSHALMDRSSMSTVHPFGRSEKTNALPDTAEACARAMERWRQVLAEQSLLLTRLAAKAVQTSPTSNASLPALAAAGLPVRLLHVRVQSNLRALEAHVRTALAPFAQFQQWQQSLAESDDVASSSDGLPRSCHRVLCLVSQLHELCDLQADATRGFDAQLRAPYSGGPSPSSASFPADLLHQMSDVTASMDKLSCTLWHTLEQLLGTSPTTCLPGPAAKLITTDRVPHVERNTEAKSEEWLSDVLHTNAEASSVLDACLSPPTRHGSLDPHTVAVLVASPSPLARRLQWPSGEPVDRTAQLRSHSRGSVASSSGCSPVRLSARRGRDHSHAAALPSLSPWRPEDESGVADEESVERAVTTQLFAAPATTTMAPALRERAAINIHTAAVPHHKRNRKDESTSQAAHASLSASPLPAAPQASAPPSWSIPPPLISREMKLVAQTHSVSEEATRSRSAGFYSMPPPAPSTIGGPSLGDCEAEEEEDEVDDDDDDADEAITDAGAHEAHVATPRDSPDRSPPPRSSKAATGTTHKGRTTPSRSPASTSPPSPLTNQALQALRTSYDRKAARLEAALRERESVIAALQHEQQQQQQQQQQQHRATETLASAPHAVPPSIAQSLPVPPLFWCGFPPSSYAGAAPDHRPTESYAPLQQELDTLRQQQAQILTLLQSSLAAPTHTTSEAPSARAAQVTEPAPKATTETPSSRGARADSTVSESHLHAMQDRNERLLRDNMHLKKRLFALEMDMRRTAPAVVAPSFSVAADSPLERTTSPTVARVTEPASVHSNRRRAILDKLFAARSTTRGVAGSGSPVGARAPRGAAPAGRETPLDDNEEDDRSFSRAPVQVTRSSFFTQHPSFPFTAPQTEASRRPRAASAPSRPATHPYGAAALRINALRPSSTSPPSPLPQPRASSSLPSLRHHAWRLGDEAIEEAALALLSRPVGSGHTRTPRATVESVKDSLRHAPRPSHVHGSADRGSVGPPSSPLRHTEPLTDAGLSPLQSQRAEVWRSLRRLTAASAEKPSRPADVSVSPMTEADRTPASSSSTTAESEADIVSVTLVEPTLTERVAAMDRHFPLPAYVNQSRHHPSNSHNRREASSSSGHQASETRQRARDSLVADDGERDADRHGSVPALEPTLLSSPAPWTRAHSRPHGASEEAEMPLFDPLHSLITSHSPPPRSLRPADTAVERRLTLSRSRSSRDGSAPAEARVLSPSPPPPPPPSKSSATHASRSASVHSARETTSRHPTSADPLRGRSRTLPPAASHVTKDDAHGGGRRRSHVRDDLARTLEDEHATLSATLNTLRTQSEQVASKRHVLRQHLSQARGQPERTADLQRLLQRLEVASEAVTAKTAELYAQRDRVSQQLQLLRDDVF